MIKNTDIVFYTIISSSHWAGCRTDEFIKSFKHFHPDIKLVVFGESEIDSEFSKNPQLNFYNCKAHFAKLLYNDYKLVVNIDSDHLILGTLDSILEADYDVAAPANYNMMANATIPSNKGDSLVNALDFFQGGLIASTCKKFWDDYDNASIKHSHKYLHSENDILNILLAINNYKVKYLEINPADVSSYYGCSSLGQEKNFKLSGNQITLNNKPVKAYHFSWGGIKKRHPAQLFSKQVTDFIYSNIVTNNMIPFKRADRSLIDLSVSEKFKQHYSKGQTYAKYIIENEVNPGLWFDSLLDTIAPEGVIVDAGANVGMFTAYLSTAKGKRKFYCIEPTGSHVEVLRDLTEKLDIPCEIFEGVVWKENGYVCLFEEKSNSTMNRVNASGSTNEVDALTLKSLFEKWNLQHVDLLKLDIESAEQQVIMEDATVGDALKKCNVVLIEVHPQDGFGNKVDVEGIINKMKSFGFIHKEGSKGLAHYFYQIPNG